VIDTGRETDRQTETDRETERKTSIQTDRDTDRKTDIQRDIRDHLGDGVPLPIDTQSLVRVKVALRADGTRSSRPHHKHKVTAITRADGTDRRQLDTH